MRGACADHSTWLDRAPGRCAMRTPLLWPVTVQALSDWWEDNCLRLAASLAFYTALSLAPLVLLVVGLVGIVLERQQVAGQLAMQLEGLMGPAGRQLVEAILTTPTPQHGILATVIGLVTLLLGATAVRSEEHTSELQSLRHLVCRLLLEKKK